MLIYLEKILFYFLIFCLPFQTRKIFYQWGDSFNEWTSAYLYLTDVLLILIFFLWFWRIRKQRFFKNPFSFQMIIKKPSFWLVFFLIISSISLIRANNIQLGFYHWFKLLEMTGLFFYLKYNFKQLLNFKKLAYVFIASGLCQSIIAISQYIQQKSLGLKFLAESPLGIEIDGIAKIIVNGTKIVRVYGTFPHPNVLAASLVLSIFCFYFLWLSKKHSFLGYCSLLIVYCSLLTALWLTFSRIIIFTFLLSSLIYFIFIFWQSQKIKDKQFSKKIISIFLLFIVYCSLFIVPAWSEISSRFSVSLTEQSIGLRVFYTQAAFSIIKDCPLLGIGIGNFVWEIRQMINLLSSWIHQPVHNVYLLIASETGLIGLFLFLFFIFQLLRKINRQEGFLLLLVFSFLFIALFDHFFWTLQQGQLMFWLVLGIMKASRFY